MTKPSPVKLFEQKISETKGDVNLQNFFINWDEQKNLAGVPAWFSNLSRPPKRTKVASHGFNLHMDVKWETEDAQYIAELKSSDKYQEIALAQALATAWALDKKDTAKKSKFISILVTRYSGWLRSAIAALDERRLDLEYIKYFEFTALGKRNNSNRPFIVFEEPFAKWDRCRAPFPSEKFFKDGSHAHWYKVKKTNTWYAMPARMPIRPPFMDGKYSMLSLVGNGEPTATNAQFIFWQGHGVPKEGTVKKNDKRFVGEYHLISKATQTEPIDLFCADLPERKKR